MSDQQPSDTSSNLPAAPEPNKSNLPAWTEGWPAAAVARMKKAKDFLVGEGGYYFDTWSEKKTTNKGREIISNAVAAKAAKMIAEEDPRAATLFDQGLKRLVGEQATVEEIFADAIVDASGAGTAGIGDGDISDDWLNKFRRLASEASSERMKAGFAKILSGEIQKPGSFSPLAMQAFSVLSPEAVAVLQKFTACAISGGPLFGPMLCSLGKAPGANDLDVYGLNYHALTVLQEHGLLTHSFTPYQTVNELIFAAGAFCIGGKFYSATKNGEPLWMMGFKDGVVDQEGLKQARMLQFTGPALTKAGAELFGIVEVEQNEQYLAEFQVWLKNEYQLDLVPTQTRQSPPANTGEPTDG
ncbi:DUF2806 domain-containing protein [Rhizobium sp. OAE497]|uniref:DUF2806 domain-containing protein n=1 Tax=Rhizobium sp. OAE497 TaxID=2663796 RepID=UPI0018F3C948